MKKVALVSGGNRGIGLEICRQLAAKNHSVILTARDVQKGQAAAAELPGDVRVYPLDVCNTESIAQLAAAVANNFAHIDVLINNAGISIGSRGAADPDFAKVRQTMDTNFFGAWQLSVALLPLMRRSPEGRIINVSSGMGAFASLTGGYAGYRLSKSALNALTVLLANELKRDGITVNAVCPGWVRTDMGGSSAPRSVQKGAETAVWLATQAGGGPTGQFFRDRTTIPW